MNWEEYLDPYLNKQQYWGNAPAQEPTIRMPRPSDYHTETLRSYDRTLGDWLGDMMVPEIRDYAATGQGKPGMIAEFADTLAGKIGSLAKMGMAAAKGIPAMAGLISIKNKQFPDWFFHRSIKPQELDFWDRIKPGAGGVFEKPVSLYNKEKYPVVFPTSMEDDLGLLINSRIEDVPFIGTGDLFSQPERVFKDNKLIQEKWAPIQDKTGLLVNDINKPNDIIMAIKDNLIKHPYDDWGKLPEAIIRADFNDLSGLRVSTRTQPGTRHKAEVYSKHWGIPLFDIDPVYPYQVNSKTIQSWGW